MIDNILDLLQLAKGETENIKIAQGKYHLPDNFKDVLKTIKKEREW
jgi:hypothetical protein|tara:strand:- start:368 stop:505 length:138 start_codon:yes stop_codon:yes gene_type:complete